MPSTRTTPDLLDEALACNEDKAMLFLGLLNKSILAFFLLVVSVFIPILSSIYINTDVSKDHLTFVAIFVFLVFYIYMIFFSFICTKYKEYSEEILLIMLKIALRDMVYTPDGGIRTDVTRGDICNAVVYASGSDYTKVAALLKALFDNYLVKHTCMCLDLTCTVSSK